MHLQIEGASVGVGLQTSFEKRTLQFPPFFSRNEGSPTLVWMTVMKGFDRCCVISPPAVSCSYPRTTTLSPGLQSSGGHRGRTCRFPSDL